MEHNLESSDADVGVKAKATHQPKEKKGRWDARLPRPSSSLVLAHGQLGRSNLQVQHGNVKRMRKGTGPTALAGNNLSVKPSNGYKIIAVSSAKMDELQRLIAYSDKQSWLACPANFCGYRELADDETLGRAIMWHAIRKEPYWFKLITEKWYPLLNRVHFGGKVHSGTAESEPSFSKCAEGTLARTADHYLVANVGGYGHDDGIYLLDPSYHRNTKRKGTPVSFPGVSGGKNIRDADVYRLNDTVVDQWLTELRRKSSTDIDRKMAESICRSRQVLLPMDHARNQQFLALRLDDDMYWKA